MKRSYLEVVILSFLLVSCAGAPVRAQSGEPDFVVTTNNQDDRVDIQYQNGRVTIDVSSPGGIGSAAFEIKSGDTPEEIILRLHLKGLEDFRIVSARDNIAVSVSTSDPSTVRQRLVIAGNESAILPDHPLWLETRIVPEQSGKTLPLEDGFFEITIPREFIQNMGDSFEIEWIDFYR